MFVRLSALAISVGLLALCGVVTGASASQDGGTIAFATNRAQNFLRSTVYSVREDGKARRLVALPATPSTSLVRSPGGGRILFSRVVGGVGALFVARPSGAGPVRLSPPELSAVVDVRASAFSADGGRVAFTTATGCGYRCFETALYLVDVDGSNLRLLAEGGRQPSWAPDGRRLVYSTGSENIVLDLARGTRRALGPGYRPVWAPRGERIAYNVTSRGYGIACFVQADGSRRRCLPGRSSSFLLWSPDAKRVAFEQAYGRLGIVGADARGLRLFKDRMERPQPGAWSPDGRRLAIIAGERSNRQIFVKSLVRRGAPRRVTSEARETFFNDVRWRRGRISYVAQLTQNDYEIAVRQPDGGVRILTNNRWDDRNPDLSPDGAWIVYSRLDRAGEALHLIEVNGSRRWPLTGSGPWRDTSATWSPDGRRIAFVRIETNDPGLFVVNRDGSGLRQLATPPVHPRGISWSPDGSEIAVAANAGGGPYPTADLYLVKPDGSGFRRLVARRAGLAAPKWSPDGTRILFAAWVSPSPNLGGRLDLYTVSADGSGETHVAANVSPASPAAAWSPDGTRIVFTRDAAEYSWPPMHSLVVANADGSGAVEITRDPSSNVDPSWSR